MFFEHDSYKSKPKQVKINITKEKENVRIQDSDDEITFINIASDKHDKPVNYNDYMVDLEDLLGRTISGIKEIILNDIKLQFDPTIDNTNNEFDIIYNNDPIPISIEGGKHKINDIIEDINSALKQEGFAITLRLSKDNKIIFEQTNNNNFELDFSATPLGTYLGFIKKKYEGAPKYTAENPHMFNRDPIYLYVPLFSKDQPFATLFYNGSFNQELQVVPKKLSHLIFQFKREKTIEDRFVNLPPIPHHIELEVRA